MTPAADTLLRSDDRRPAGWRKTASLLAAGLSILLGAAAIASAPASPCRTPAWSAAIQRAVDPEFYPGSDIRLGSGTIRQIIRVSARGDAFRITYSNLYGVTPLVIDQTRVAAVAPRGTEIPAPDISAPDISSPGVAATFGGRASVTIPPGGTATSDAVAITARVGDRLAVSSFFAAPPGRPRSVHLAGKQTLFVSPGANATTAAALPATATTSRVFLARLDACRPDPTRTIVALGDSITDGTGSTDNADRRWPDALADRLTLARRDDLSVVDQGIDGNRLLHDRWGEAAVKRLDRDVLAIPGVRYLILLEGINDIYAPAFLHRPDERVTARQIIGAYRNIIARARRRRIKVILATLLPDEGADVQTPGYHSRAGEAERQAVNRWIRTGHAAYAVIDWDKTMADPARPARINPAYDSGDHLHPNDAGYRAMAAAIDLALFAPAR